MSEQERMKKVSVMEEQYRQLLPANDTESADEESTDLRQPLWGKVVPSYTTVGTAVNEK